MAITKTKFFILPEHIFEIRDICEEEFAERLRAHIGKERIGRPSGGHREFSGVVTRNSFEIRRNNVTKLADYEVYGKFRASGGHLTLMLTIMPRPLEWMLAVVSFFAGIYYVSEEIAKGRYDLLYIFIGSVILFGIGSWFGKSREIQKLSGHIEAVFSDKEIV